MQELTKKNYVDEAEKVVKKLEKDKFDKFILTTSKIRNILSMISGIYNDVTHCSEEELNDDIVERIQYLRMRFAYEAGREPAVKDLMIKAEITSQIKAIGTNKEKCSLFCKYMEAIVAYHKFYGGQD